MVENNFLPIGTVCKLKNSNIKIMITGFLPTSVSGTVNLFDYVGYVYPKGTLDGESFYFNKDEIIEVIFEGYKSEEHGNLSKVLTKYKGVNEANNEKVLPNASEIKFNNEGTVVDDGINEIINEIIIEPQKVNTDLPKFEFDANGYVVKANEDLSNNPFKVEEFTTDELKANNNWDIFKEIKFDVNGVVVADGLKEANNIPEAVINGNNIKSSGIKFDANGTVIADDFEVLNTNDNAYTIKFDSNGMVVADGSSEYSLDSKPAGGIRFDANGIVISE